MIDWPDELIEDFKNKRVIPFIGSGVSRNSIGKDNQTRPKTWEQFLNHAADKFKIKERIEKYINSHDYLTALEVIKANTTPHNYAKTIKEEYLAPGFKAAEIHESIYRLDCKITLSPNFDKIYETYVANESQSTIVSHPYYHEKLANYIRGDSYIVIKTHGSVDDCDNMIFSRTDYAQARTRHASFYDILRALILTHTFLFIGCGIDDPDIRLILEDTNFWTKGARPHYFVCEKGSINKDMENILSKTMNLTLLEYNNENKSHSELTEDLKNLAENLS